MQTSSSPDLQQQLEALTICPKKSHTEKHCNSCMMNSTIVSSSASSLFGDYIGMESCFDLDNNTNQEFSTASGGGGGGGCGKRDRRMTAAARRREFPPPIPSLARTDHNLPSHMPWVLKRYYTSDGRLILREEKVKQHEYLRAHRSNGRLTLHLVPLDDNNIGDDQIDGDDAEKDDVNNAAAEEEEEEDIPKIDVEDSFIDKNGININAAAANGGKCMNYSSVSVSVRASPTTCFLGLPAVPAMRPVHS